MYILHIRPHILYMDKSEKTKVYHIHYTSDKKGECLKKEVKMVYVKFKGSHKHEYDSSIKKN